VEREQKAQISQVREELRTAERRVNELWQTCCEHKELKDRLEAVVRVQLLRDSSQANHGACRGQSWHSLKKRYSSSAESWRRHTERRATIESPCPCWSACVACRPEPTHPCALQQVGWDECKREAQQQQVRLQDGLMAERVVEELRTRLGNTEAELREASQALQSTVMYSPPCYPPLTQPFAERRASSYDRGEASLR
jgi:hypothetical protein